MISQHRVCKYKSLSPWSRSLTLKFPKKQPTQHVSVATMSKITPKNLHYDDTPPPFLARFRANNASRDGREEYHVVRPKKARNAEEEAEDEPVYFDEGTGETLT